MTYEGDEQTRGRAPGDLWPTHRARRIRRAKHAARVKREHKLARRVARRGKVST